MTTSQTRALQDAWPSATCYGCGPSNAHGLQLKSYWSETGDETLCVFHPKPYHNAGFDNVMYGGLVASLCDCHSVWTAIASAYRQEGREHGSSPAISYVTGNLNVTFLAPTRMDIPVTLRAHVEESTPRKSIVVCNVFSGHEKTAEARVVAVRFSRDKSVGAANSGQANQSGQP